VPLIAMGEEALADGDGERAANIFMQILEIAPDNGEVLSGLIRAFTKAAYAAWREPDTREAAAITFLVTASGATFGGISGAFWGLVAGGAMMGLSRVMRPRNVS